MAKPSKDADRRAIVEQMRREQQSKERRKSLMVLGAAVLVGALIIGVAVWQFMKAGGSSAGDLANIGTAAAEAGCQEVQVEKAEGNNDHRPDGEKILYKATPPATGPHWGTFLQGAQIRKLYTADDRPPVEQLVHSLEHGHTVLWYDESIAESDEAMEELEILANKFQGTDLSDKFIAAPWTSDDGEPFPDDAHVALTHWSMGGTNGNPEGQQGITQFCTEISGEVVEDFMKDYPYRDSPEPTAP